MSSLILTKESLALLKKNLSSFWEIYRRNTMGLIGFFILVFYALLAFLGPQLVSVTTFVLDGVTQTLHPPASGYWLGTDNLGKDVFAGVIIGTRVSLMVGVAATVISMTIGTVIGIVAGFYGKTVDALLMRITDVFLVIPWLPLMLVMAALLGPSLGNIIFVIGITSWASTILRRLKPCTHSSPRQRPRRLSICKSAEFKITR